MPHPSNIDLTLHTTQRLKARPTPTHHRKIIVNNLINRPGTPKPKI
jgi:hypothetical protein